MGWKRADLIRVSRGSAPIWLVVATGRCWAAPLAAWEGHDWSQWKHVTTWHKPLLTNDQVGRYELVPVLGGPPGDTNRVDSVKAWEDRRKQFAFAISQVLGEPTNLSPPKLEVRELGAEEMEGYSRRHLLIRSEVDDWIPAYLLLPKPLPTNTVPAMICLHQTVAQGKEEPCGTKGDPELAFALELVRRGCVCIAPDSIGFGERIPAGTQPYQNSIAFYRKHPSWSFMAKMIWDVGRVVDYLESLPQVDPRRIGCIGHSHGAYGTLFAAAFKPRISAAIASCGFTTFRSDPSPERWSHATALIPQLGSYLPDVASIPFDWHHVLGLIAPRPLFVWYATKDSIFPRTENLKDVLSDVSTIYSLYGEQRALAWEAYEGPHKFPESARAAAYRWLDETFARSPVPAAASTNSLSAAPKAKVASAFFPAEVVERARANAKAHLWAARIRDSLVSAAKPWMGLSDEELWNLMFGNTIRRSWQVWSDGHCPSCGKPVPMYEWVADVLNQPWKMRCPRCKELFPKNDFMKYYRSGLTEVGVFDPKGADRSLLFNTDHPDPADPQHTFGVDDGEGYIEGGKRWRFIGTYLIFGQWKQAIVGGIRNLAAAYVATGDVAYAHKAGVLLDRVADLYPTFDFGKEGVLYEGPARSGYISTWHDACVEVQELALAYDAVFEGVSGNPELVTFLAVQAAKHHLSNRKSSFADIQRNIEERIFRDTLANRPKIESNYPATDVTLATIHTVLDWPANRGEVLKMLDAIITKATAVDGLTGEKGITGYTVIAPHAIAELLGRYARADPAFMSEMLLRHSRLHDMYRFHLDTWCLGQYYPRIGDTGSFAEKTSSYVGLSFSKNPGINPSSYAFLWELYAATGDVDFVRLLFGANDSSTEGLPYDLFADDPAAFQGRVAQVLAETGAEINQTSVNKTEWCLAILRSGKPPYQRAAWLDYDSGERHGHADAMTIGLFARGLDLLPDFGYPPVQYGGWGSPRSVWYTLTPAHNTVSVDGQNTRPGHGKTTLWFDGVHGRVVRASGAKLIGGQQYERTVALVDISEKDSYLIDVFRVVGGKEHSRFWHGHFGRVSTQGLSLAPAEEPHFGSVWRAFRKDSQPTEGWSLDLAVDDHLKYLPAGSDVHLRHTDLTRGAEAELAEAWVSVGLYGGTADAWIPSFLLRRHAAQSPLASTFVDVMEPYEAKSNLVGIRRLKLRDGEANLCADDDVGIEVHLADGRCDIFLSRQVETAAASLLPRPGTGAVVEETSGARFEGDLCLIRLDAAHQPERVCFCHGKTLRVGPLLVRARDAEASFEISLDQGQASVVAGPAEAVELIEVAGVKLLPK